MIDRSRVRQLREQMQTVLEPLGRELNVKFHVGNASYTADNAHFKVEAAAIQANGQVVDQAAADFKRLASLYGLKPEHLGQEFSNGGRQFVITGLKPRCRRYPILARCQQTGKIFKLPSEAVSSAL